MIKGLRIRLYPNAKQKEMLEVAFANTALVYNETLAYLMEPTKDQKEKSIIDCLNFYRTTIYKRHGVIFSETSSYLLEKSVIGAYQYYCQCLFKGKTPRPKDDKKTKSFHVDGKKEKAKFASDAKHIQFISLGTIRTSMPMVIPTVMYNITIRKDDLQKYWMSMGYERNEMASKKKVKQAIGIDLGLTDCVVLSDGTKFIEPERVVRLSRRLARMNKALGRKQHNSHNKEKLLLKIAKTKGKMTDICLNYYHNITNYLVQNYSFIAMEDLAIKNMMNRKENLAKKFLETRITSFVRILKYKCEYEHVTLQLVPRFYPSSQICHACGYKNDVTKNLKVREYECPNCHTRLDRDVNASINILNEGKRLYLMNNTKA